MSFEVRTVSEKMEFLEFIGKIFFVVMQIACFVLKKCFLLKFFPYLPSLGQNKTRSTGNTTYIDFLASHEHLLSV